VRTQLERKDGVADGVYARVYMKLGEVLAGEFFTEYIKKGTRIYFEGRGI
jgi:ribonuclease P/MRP protein subunit RPP40